MIHEATIYGHPQLKDLIKTSQGRLGPIKPDTFGGAHVSSMSDRVHEPTPAVS